MAHSDKNIVITPNISSTTADPKIVFSGADASTGAQNITLQVYPTNSGTLSFEGSAGQLFSITNSMTGTIYSVNDVSGIPSIEVLDTGLVKLAQYSGNILLGTGTDDGSKFQVKGSVRAGNNSWNSSPASTVFSHTLSANSGTNRVVNFDGNGSTPSVWWTNGSRALGAIDGQDPGLTFWSNNGSAWQKQMTLNHGSVNIDTTLTSSGNISAGGGVGVSNTSNSTGTGISLYNGGQTGIATYGISFAGTPTFGTYGDVSGDWATYFTMNNSANRGWIFRDVSTPSNVASISNSGNATFAGYIKANGIQINQYNANSARIYSATTGAAGLLIVDSAGSYRVQLYGDGSNYGFLDSAWGNWDINKTVNGQMYLRVGGSNYNVIHVGNASSYVATVGKMLAICR